MISNRSRYRLSIIPLVCLLLSACATVPLTNRRQLKLIPQNQLLSMSFQQYNKVKSSSKLINPGSIKRVGDRIAAAANQFMRDKQMNLSMQWEFILIKEDKTVNAWCMPGGKVAFYTGILPLTKSDAGIAVVMGHEIAHALAEHGNERMSQALLVNLGGASLATAMSKQKKNTQKLWMQAYGLGSQVGLLLPYSRTHEYEADYIGLILMAKAGYNPQEAVSFWTGMSKMGGKKPPEFLSTHPIDTKRIEAINNHLPEAMQYYQASKKK